jgi:ribonucleotide monophosphatase NagD (HAD superfamily)
MHVLPGAVRAVERLCAMGKRVVLTTNNSTRSRADYANKCKQQGTMGVDTTHNSQAFLNITHIHPGQVCSHVLLGFGTCFSVGNIVTTSAVVAAHLRHTVTDTRTVYLIGSRGKNSGAQPGLFDLDEFMIGIFLD